MSLGTRLLPKAYLAEAALTKFRFVQPGSVDAQKVILAAAVDDKIIGVGTRTVTTADLAGVSPKDQLSVDTVGETDLTAGGTVAPGDLLTSDATGRGVTAAPAAGVNNRIGAMALEAGVIGQTIRVLLIPGGQIQGA
ncbi:MAG: hypothetical protein V3T23_03980 [Nitrososphaerales archaeon]